MCSDLIEELLAFDDILAVYHACQSLEIVPREGIEQRYILQKVNTSVDFPLPMHLVEVIKVVLGKVG